MLNFVKEIIARKYISLILRAQESWTEKNMYHIRVFFPLVNGYTVRSHSAFSTVGRANFVFNWKGGETKSPRKG